MSSARGLPLAWIPPVDEDCFDVETIDAYQAPRRSFSPPSSASSPDSEYDQPFSRPTGNHGRRRHDPGWVARPRNAFIIFRCEYSQIHCRQGPRVRRPPGTSTEPTLSKRAAIAWSQMSSEEKEPYRFRAEEERNDHARNHPDYRFRPQRRPGSNGRRYTLRQAPSSCSLNKHDSLDTPVSKKSVPPLAPYAMEFKIEDSALDSLSISDASPISQADKYSPVFMGWNGVSSFSVGGVESQPTLDQTMSTLGTTGINRFPGINYADARYLTYPDVWYENWPPHSFSYSSSPSFMEALEPTGFYGPAAYPPVTISSYTTLGDAVFGMAGKGTNQ